MRIESTSTIRVSGRSGTVDHLAGLQKGAEITARIVDRKSGRDAILEIGGKRIHAEFQKGIPAGAMITLKLDEIKDGSLLFKMVDPGGRDALARRFLEATIADMGLIQKNMGSALAKHPAGIFELNALLLGLTPKSDKKEDGLTRFLGRLLKLGVDRGAVTDLSILLSGARFDSKALHSLFLLLGFDGERIRKWTRGKPGNHDSMIGAIMNEIDRLEEGETKETVLRQLIGYATQAAEMPAGYVTGELPFHDGDDLRPVRFLGKGDAWVFSVDFSGLGRVEVLARTIGDEYPVTVFCETREALEALKGSAEMLAKNMKNIGSGIHVNFYNTDQAINKIVEIYSYYSLNSVFDIRV
ncbi:MAG: hypothetical protein KA369_01180 [Spirochaetes bacterium]|nr:hypothetical protein [Spirochaetota bacterium]